MKTNKKLLDEYADLVIKITNLVFERLTLYPRMTDDQFMEQEAVKKLDLIINRLEKKILIKMNK